MIFVVQIDVTLPADMQIDEKSELLRRETERAFELMDTHNIQHIWRVVGQTANVGIWQANTLEELHEHLTSMPLFPYVKVNVVPVIEHPATNAWIRARTAAP